MVSWAVRFMVVGGLGTGRLEEYYSLRAKEIRDGRVKTAEALRKAMKSIVPSDATFRQVFAAARVSKSKLARYYLRVLERQMSGEDQPELLPNENEEEVNLEHVLPQKPGQGWQKIDNEVVDAYVTRIGNFALMKEVENRNVGNEPPGDKAQVYQTSRLSLTRDVATRIKETKRWGPEEITARQSMMADLAVKAWALSLK
jgi:hypothetical protein